MKSNEVFIFQMVDIQRFVKRKMNCDNLLVSVIVCKFANEINPCVGTIKQGADMKHRLSNKTSILHPVGSSLEARFLSSKVPSFFPDNSEC